LVVAAGWLVVKRPHRSSPIPQSAEWSSKPSQNLAILAGQPKVPRRPGRAPRPIYNYSVIRGGVHSAGELREAVARDPAVAAHYAGFHYENARMIRLERRALVYLSYKMNEKIYWTKTKHPLNAGEELITDGTISARSKCANQISVKKQLAVSAAEPPAERLEEVEAPPIPPPAEVRFPTQYQTALLTPPASEPSPEPWNGPPGGPGWIPIYPPPLPKGACEPQWKENQEHRLGIDDDDDSKENICKKKHHKPPGPVPEPGTIILVSSGLAATYAAYRRKRLAAQK
jgi:hypothetical protein